MMKPTSIIEGHRRLENELQPSVITGTAQHHLGNKTYGMMAESWQQYPALLFLFFIFFLSSNNCLGPNRRESFSC
jgi:hypothetical protein